VGAHLEVDDVVDGGEVEAARGDVGGEQHALRLRHEAVDGLEARALLHVALRSTKGRGGDGRACV